MKGQILLLLFGIVAIVLGLAAIVISWEADYIAPTSQNYQGLLADRVRLQQDAPNLKGEKGEINWIQSKVACDKLDDIYYSFSIAKRRKVQRPDCVAEYDILPVLGVTKEKSYSAWEREYIIDLKARKVVRGLF
jgi:hypothetical protein